MASTHITIDRLELDLRGIPPGIAQQAVASLGPVLERAIATRMAGPPASDSDVSSKDVAQGAEIRLDRNPPAGVLRQALAERIAATVAARMNPHLPADPGADRHPTS